MFNKMTQNEIINNMIISLKSIKKYDDQDIIEDLSISFKNGNEKITLGIIEDNQFYYNSTETNHKDKFISQIKAREIIRNWMFPSNNDTINNIVENKIITYFINQPNNQLSIEELEKIIKNKNIEDILSRLIIKGVLNYWSGKYSLSDIDINSYIDRNKNISEQKENTGTGTWRRKILLYLKKRNRPATIGDILNFGIKSDNLYKDREYIIPILNQLIQEKKIIKNGQNYTRKQ